jgi:alpha-N-arabinofuranosidase
LTGRFDENSVDAVDSMDRVDELLTLIDNVVVGKYGPYIHSQSDRSFLSSGSLSPLVVVIAGDQREDKPESFHGLWLSLDKWNAWYRTTTGDTVDGHQQEAPHLLEEVYNLEDALLVGGPMNSLTPTEFSHNSVPPFA